MPAVLARHCHGLEGEAGQDAEGILGSLLIPIRSQAKNEGVQLGLGLGPSRLIHCLCSQLGLQKIHKALGLGTASLPGIKLLQARPLRVAEPTVPDDIWLQHPRLDGHPSGIGWASGRARVVNCECELERVAPGDVLVTTVAGPALGTVLAHVAGVVAELGGSTSHLASLARERGVPMVLGVLDATRRIPDGATVAVDGVSGVVRWMQ